MKTFPPPARPGDAGTLCFSAAGVAALIISGACLTAGIGAAFMGSALLCLGCVLVTAGLWIVAAHDSATTLIDIARRTGTRRGRHVK